MQKITITTAQNVQINFLKATLGDRVLALGIDIIIQFTYFFTLLFLVMLSVKGEIAFLFSSNFFIWWIVGILPLYAYHFFFEWLLDGQSPGKYWMKIKVVKLDASPLSAGPILLRWLFRTIDVSPILIGIPSIILIGVTRYGQRLGDLVAGTMVISLREEVRLKDTMFEFVKSDYIPKHPTVRMLEERDIDMIKLVLKKGRYNNTEDLMNRMADKISNKIKVDEFSESEAFLKTVLLDYNYYR